MLWLSISLSNIGSGPVSQMKVRGIEACRYYICDKKLLSLGWKEEETWEHGLKETIDWYLANGFSTYWENGNVEAALSAHPTLTASSTVPPISQAS
jgi:dTDP-D-glucose 4,6-dehydratase